MEEIDISEVKRSLYLHEAGHAVVAFETGFFIRSLVCDGEIGHLDAGSSSAHAAAMSKLFADKEAGVIDGEELLRKGIEANRPQLAVWLGGIAGESLSDAGRPILSTRRGADDISTFFSYLNVVTRNLNAARFAPAWQDAFVRAQDIAWDIVRRREAAVRKVAESLARSGTVSGGEFGAILSSLA